MAGDILLITVLAISCYTDLRYRRIYNLVTFPALLGALLINYLTLGLDGLWISGQGLLLAAALFILPFLLGGLGAGDVKLLAVVGAVKGGRFVFQAFLLTAIIGGLLTIGFLLSRRKLFPTLRLFGRGLKVFFYSGFRIWNFGSLNKETAVTDSVPYGLAIVLGSLAAYWVM